MLEEALITSHSPNVLFPEGETSAEFERALQAMHTLQVARAPKPGLDLTDTRTESRKRDAEMFWTNAMPTEDGCSAVFPIVARFNHSCVPNALFHWSIELKKECVVVVQDIQAGQEICVHYRENDMFCSRAERQHMLQQGFGFECHCLACDSPRFVQSDSNRSEIRRLQQQLSSYKDDEDRHDEALDEECYHRALGNVKTMMELAQQEGLDNPKFLGTCCHKVFEVSVLAGQRSAAREWARKAADHWELHYGPKERAVRRMRKYARNPPTKIAHNADCSLQ